MKKPERKKGRCVEGAIVGWLCGYVEIRDLVDGFGCGLRVARLLGCVARERCCEGFIRRRTTKTVKESPFVGLFRSSSSALGGSGFGCLVVVDLDVLSDAGRRLIGIRCYWRKAYQNTPQERLLRVAQPRSRLYNGKVGLNRYREVIRRNQRQIRRQESRSERRFLQC